MDDVILAIDCGTQSTRALLFSASGDLLAKEKVSYVPYYSKMPGWAEQSAEVYWNALCEACKALKKNNKKHFKNISGLGITAMRDSIINLDVNGNPIRPMVHWLDERKAERVYDPKGPMRWIYNMAGMGEGLFMAQVDAPANWINQNQPEIAEKTHMWVQPSGFLNFRLTRNFIDSIASQIGHLPFNYHKQRWCTPKEINYLLVPIERKKLPDLVKPGDRIGEVTLEAEKLTGIPAGTPVIACGSDKGCETIGMGVMDGSMASLSFGTTATVQSTTNRYCEPLKYMPAYPAPVPDMWNPEVQIFRGYWMITWFKNEFGYKEMQEAEKAGIVPEILLDKLLAQVPAGSMGLITQPSWKPSLKVPFAKGAIIGFGDVHTRAHVYRSVIEGLGFALYEGMRKIEKAMRSKVKMLAVSGGASQSDQICQLSADIFNLPLVRGETYENSGLGAAMLTAFGIGIYSNINYATRSMIHYGKEFTPNPKNVDLYRKLYERVYSKIFKILTPLNKEIRNITGYPEPIE